MNAITSLGVVVHIRRFLVGGVLLGLASLVSAAGFSGSGLSVGVAPVGQRPLGACGTTTLTQSTSQTITAGNSVSCNGGSPGFFHTDNSYFRAFSLGAFPDGFDVCALQFGIEQANASGTDTTQPVTVNIYANTGGVFPAGTRTLVGTTTAQVADQTLTVLEVPVTAAVPAGAELVAEVFTPNGQPAGHSFFIGSNAGGQNGTSYIAATACGISAPTPLSAIGFPNMHIVMNVVGTPTVAGSGNLTITPAAIDFGSQNVGSTSAAQTVTLANDGTVSLDVTALTAAAAPFARSGGTCSNTLPITLAAGASCTLDYTFSPTVTGAANQSLTVTANAPGSGTIALSGNGTQGNLTITPAALDFGTVLVGSTSAAQAVTLSNTGTGALDVTALTAATSPFARSGGTCSAAVPFTLAAGASCTLLYTYAPTSEAAANQVLTVTTSALGSGTITLTGGALAPSVPVPTLSGLGLGLAMLLVVLTAFWTRRRA